MREYISKMKGQQYIDKTREYLNYIETHLNNIKKAFNEVSDACKDMWWVVDDCFWYTLRAEVEWHDVSKFSFQEFTQYRETFYPLSDHEKQNANFEQAWEHHKLINSHHHEVVRFLKDIIHMVIDWTAMGYHFGDTAEKYYNANKTKIKLSDEQLIFMKEIFNKLKH